MASLRVENLSKSFGGIKALDNLNLSFLPGKVNAILGENGAGKSTLLKILSGVYTEYAGKIYLNNSPVSFSSPREAQSAGIAIIHQELNLIPHLSISENLFLGKELKTNWGILDNTSMDTITQTYISKLNIEAKANTLIKDLRIGQQQLVEIAKALLSNADIIFMDEPSSALSDKEIHNLHTIIKDLSSQQKTIVYISHKMDELFAISEYYLVLRDGCMVGEGLIKATDSDKLINLMVGRDLKISPKKAGFKGKENILQMQDLDLALSAKSNSNKINFDLKKGEILGVFGLMGAGRTELLLSIFGVNKPSRPFKMLLNGNECQFKSPIQALEAGIALLSEDRKTEGLSLDMSIAENISMSSLNSLAVINAKEDINIANKYISDLGIKANSAAQKVNTLSGGNQQKVVLSRCLSLAPKLLLLDEPTRGVDIKSKSEIYEIINALAAEGLSILMVSSEIQELLAVADRIMVMAEGKVTAIIPIEEANQENLLKHALAV